MSILDLVPTPYKIYAGVGVAVIVLGAIGGLMLSRATLKAELAEVRGRQVVCQMANKEFKEKTESQNAAIQTLRLAAETREIKAREAVTSAKRVAEGHKAKAAMIERQKNKGDDCEATKQLLDDYFGGAR